MVHMDYLITQWKKEAQLTHIQRYSLLLQGPVIEHRQPVRPAYEPLANLVVAGGTLIPFKPYLLHQIYQTATLLILVVHNQHFSTLSSTLFN